MCAKDEIMQKKLSKSAQLQISPPNYIVIKNFSMRAQGWQKKGGKLENEANELFLHF